MTENTAVTQEELEASVNSAWKFFGTVLVFFMHAGFSMLEAGSIRQKNVQNILFKNLVNVLVTTLTWWFWGYALAFGVVKNFGFIAGGSATGFVGIDLNMGHQAHSWIHWAFQWAFAATSVTILSGGMAERANSNGYLMTILYFQLLIYPVIACWVWNQQGWLYVNGFQDYAGASVVHMAGGAAAFLGCYFLGPRNGMPKACNVPNVCLGTLILWMGWYGFNAASGDIIGEADPNQPEIGTHLHQTGRVIINTTISASVAGLSNLIYFFWKNQKFVISELCNGILVGLVAITAGCGYVSDWAAFVIGLFACPFYLLGHYILNKFKIDDAIGAFPVHFMGGSWGIISTGFFHLSKGWFYNSSTIMGVQAYGWLAITSWVIVTFTPFIFLLQKTGILRVTPSTEKIGLDNAFHRTKSMFILDNDD